MLEGLFEFGRPFPHLRDLFFSLSFLCGEECIRFQCVRLKYHTLLTVCSCHEEI